MGPAGSGKSTFAARHFKPTEVTSSDFFRAMVSDDEGDQSASPAAFTLLRFLVTRRLRRRRRTCVDATNLHRRERRPLLRAAQTYRRPAIAVVFDLPLETCLERNRLRAGRRVEESVIREQWAAAPRSPEPLLEEGFSVVYKVGPDDA
ncbi:MAG TPA: AAA family ATPase [Candidatus Dormibacteraeota bacterium]